MQGRNAVITGVGRRAGIGYAVAKEFIRRGASVFVTHYEQHDREQPWGSDPAGSAGEIQILVCNHAQSGCDGPLTEMDETRLDRRFAVNTRAAILLAREFAKQYRQPSRDEEPKGRVVFLTSGHNLGPMPGEVAYAASKGAIVGVIMTLSEELAPRGITVNAVNPGPVDTGYVDEKLRPTGAAQAVPVGAYRAASPADRPTRDPRPVCDGRPRAHT